MVISQKTFRLLHFLLGIKGFGYKTVQLVCYECGVSIKSLKMFITKAQADFILNWVEANLTRYVHGENYTKTRLAFKKKLKILLSVKSLRFFSGLPVRGQRTKTNAKTAKKLNG